MHGPSGPDYRAVIRQHFGHISDQSSSGTTVIGGLMPYLGVFHDEPGNVLILSGTDMSSSVGKVLAFSDARIAAWEFGLDGDAGKAFSVRGSIVPLRALSRVELLPESTAFPPFGGAEAEARIEAALHIDGVGVFTVGHSGDYRWSVNGSAEDDLAVFRELLSRTV